MTKEEAIVILKSWTLDRDYAKEAIALDMAIKALEQEPCTVFEKTEYRSVDQTGETHADGAGWWCSVCYNVWKDEHVSPRWKYCPHCGAKIQEVKE